jgi:hypothetical protein
MNLIYSRMLKNIQIFPSQQRPISINYTTVCETGTKRNQVAADTFFYQILTVISNLLKLFSVYT